jgi:hypothetical protein
MLRRFFQAERFDRIWMLLCVFAARDEVEREGDFFSQFFEAAHDTHDKYHARIRFRPVIVDDEMGLATDPGRMLREQRAELDESGFVSRFMRKQGDLVEEPARLETVQKQGLDLWPSAGRQDIFPGTDL